MRLRFFCFLVSVFSVCSLQATHIIGGEVYYTCLGNGEYIIELRVYRDCAPGNAEFEFGSTDDNITYFICDENGNCLNQEQPDGQLLLRPSTDLTDVVPPDLECLTGPDNICVEQATFRWGEQANRRVDLNPLVDGSYVIVYQRCCRNSTIVNIENPLVTGSSFVAKILPAAQANCNSSPRFNQFPPTIICNNEPLNFDHSATDPDGDSLVYSFCNVLVGGGIEGDIDLAPTGDSEACDGAKPNPSCPNTEESVQYITPTYTAEAPMGGDPVVSINPQTGLITGTPNMIGQFVVGVCVEEYRNGQLLGSIQRDFQFNVLPCEKEVTAQIESDRTEFDRDANGNIIAKNFISSFCSTGAVNFINESFDRDAITEIRWEFADGTILNDDWDATVEFPGQGEYEGKLVLNPNSEVCSDSANIFVRILPELRAGFSSEYDSCQIGPVSFIDTSFAEASMIVNWQWDFDDGNNATQQNPNHQYDNSRNYSIRLSITDDNGCTTSATNTIEYAPAPQSVAIAQNAEGGCHPTPIVFTNNSSPLSAEYDILWDFGDGNTSTEISPTHTYESSGIYSVSLSIKSPLGCEIEANYPELINVLESPTADFTFTPSELTTTNPVLSVTDASSNAISWLYQFSNQGTSSEADPTFTFRDTGLQQIVQIVTAPSGCRDTSIQFVDIIPFVEWYMPNAFTPNRDGVNDIFIGNGNLLGAESFIFTIWNRWGELIFETDDYTQGWNGRKSNTGQDSPNGVYVYVLSYRTPRGETIQLEGFATLIR